MSNRPPEPLTSPQPPLTPEEERVILRKGTEPPFSGMYTDHFKPGLYRCRQCGAPLFAGDDKFPSHCGWPSFDAALPGAVREVPDADGSRTEITCAACGGHLGHGFLGEGFTPAGVRHCVNSISLTFEPEGKSAAEGAQTAIFAGGCFWGVEQAFREAPGVLEAVSGYTGGTSPDPDYEEVCSGASGHAEAVRVRFDPAKTTYEALARLFFEIHDPGQYNRQGPDIGSQYRSAVFYLDEEQKAVAERLVNALTAKGWEVVTQILPAGTFYPAEDYHQKFLLKNPTRQACTIRTMRFDVPAPNRIR